MSPFGCPARASAIVIALSASLAGSAFGEVFIEDGDFVPANWNAYTTNSNGGFGFATSQASAGGNPDLFRSIQHWSESGMASGLVCHLNQATWTPIFDGGIAHVVMSVDVNCFSGGTSGAVAFGLCVKQDGMIFFGPSYTALDASGWRTDLRNLQLESSDFTGLAGVKPDFSEVGSPIRFGFYSSNGTISGTAISSDSGVDNFKVQVKRLRPCAPDFDGDGQVSGADLGVLLAAWGPGNGWPDLTGDGNVDGADLGLLLAAWGTCDR